MRRNVAERYARILSKYVEGVTADWILYGKGGPKINWGTANFDYTLGAAKGAFVIPKDASDEEWELYEGNFALYGAISYYLRTLFEDEAWAELPHFGDIKLAMAIFNICRHFDPAKRDFDQSDLDAFHPLLKLLSSKK